MSLIMTIMTLPNNISNNFCNNLSNNNVSNVTNKHALGFLLMKIKKKHSVYVSNKFCEKKHVDLLLIGEEGERNYVLMKDFNTFMYDHSLHRGRKHFCRYCLQAFSAEEKFKRHIKDCLKNNGKKRL